jgi:hypothetical protein
MTLEANVIRDDAIRSTPEGYEVDIHIAWYRSLPMSCIENVDITFNGQRYAKEQLKVLHGDKKLQFEELAELTDEWWFVLDPITLLIEADKTVETGSTAKLAVSLATRIPYIIIGPNMPLVQRTDVAKEVTIQ